MSLFKKEAQLDQKLADDMLSNIFDICEVERNTVPLQELESYSNYRKDKYSLKKAITIIIIIAFLLVPLLFIAPRISMLKQAASSSPTFMMGVDSFLPVTSVTATIDGQNIPVYEQVKRKYTIQPDITGEMLITVKCLNGQYVQKKVIVANVDLNAPVAESTLMENNTLVVYLTDEESGVDYDKVYAKYADGTKVAPTSCDKTTGRLEFSNPEGTIYLIVPDNAGNKLQLQLNI